MIFRWISCVLLIAGCQQKMSQVRPHEAEDSADQKSFSLTSEDLDCRELLKSKSYDERICEFQNENLSENEIGIALKVFSETTFLSDPEINTRRFVFRLIERVNQFAILSENQIWTKKIIDLSLKNCVFLEENSCKIYNLFSRVHNTRDVFVNYLKNKEYNTNLELIFVLGLQAANSTTDYRLLDIFAQRSSELKYDKNLAALLGSKLSANIREGTKTKIQEYINADKIQLNALQSKSKIIETISNLRNELGESAILTKWKKLAQVRPMLLSALRLDKVEITPAIELYDLVFKRRIKDHDTNQVLLKLANQEELTEAFQVFVQIQLAIEIHENDLLFKSIADQIPGTLAEYSKQLYSNLDPIRLRWKQFQSAIESLLFWLSNPKIDVKYKVKMKNYTRGIDGTIKMYSEYPHMFYIAYLSSQKGFPYRVETEDGIFSLEAGDLYTYILKVTTNSRIHPANAITPWLDYTGDPSRAPELSIFNALGFVLSSQFFETFSMDSELFLTFLIRDLNKEYLDQPNQKMQRLTDYLRTSQAAYELQTFCDGLESNHPVRVQIPFTALYEGFLFSSFRPELMSNTAFRGDGTPQNGPLPFDLTEIKDLHESFNTDSNMVENILNTINSRLRRNQKSSKIVSSSLLQLKKNKKFAQQAFKSWIKRGACVAQIYAEEKKIFEHVVTEETKYLLRVHEDVKALGDAASPRETQQILSRYHQSYLFKDIAQRKIKPLDRISGSGYLYSQFDFLGRTAHYLQSYSPKFIFEIVLPERLEKTESYNYNAGTSKINWRHFSSKLSKEELIEEAHRIFLTSNYFVKWGEDADTHFDKYSMYISNLISLYKTQKTVTTDAFFFEYLKYIKYIQLSELERKMLTASRRETLIDLRYFDRKFLSFRMRASNENVSEEMTGSKDAQKTVVDKTRVKYITRLYGLFDMAMLTVNADVLGWDYWVELQREQESDCSDGHCTDYETNKKYRKGPLAESEAFYLDLRHFLNRSLIYPLDEQLVKDNYLRLKRDVEKHTLMVEQFIRDIKAHESPELYVDISTTVRISEPTISQKAMSRVLSQRGNFHLKTQSCFKIDAKCF